jgi:hypothetical protein
MAHIVQFRMVPFRMGAAREVVEAESRGGEGAQIVIFPGVRRERHAKPRSRPPVKGPPERDILELPD